ncbi:MAG: bifunctional oligoribonuclease/PAP phosphatase NrnA [Candidatus Bruticola sp.]
MNLTYQPPQACFEIAQVLLQHDNFLIVPHVNIDGDDLGSMVACAQILKSLHKNYYLYSPDGTPEIFKFIKGTAEIHTELPVGASFDVALVLECPQPSRLPKDLNLSQRCSKVINLDHHPMNNLSADFNWIDPSFAALGEMLYFVFQAMNVEINRECAEALYTSIVSDSGSFRFSATSPRTHQAAAHLLSILGDISYIHNQLFSSFTLNDLKLQSMCLQTLKVYADGKLVTACLTEKMLKACNLEEKDTQMLLGRLNVMKGCEVFALFKAVVPNEVRVSLRSKKIVINDIAARHSGGGHALAAACRFASANLEEVYSQLIPELLDKFI